MMQWKKKIPPIQQPKQPTKAADLLAGSAGAEGQWHAKQHPVYAAGTGMASGTVRI